MPSVAPFKFFPGDWLADPAVRSCSLAARGLWIDMLVLMHQSSRVGHLLTGSGSPLAVEKLSRIAGCTPAETTRLLAELISGGVCGRASDGAVFCGWMVRDEGKRAKLAAGAAATRT